MCLGTVLNIVTKHCIPMLLTLETPRLPAVCFSSYWGASVPQNMSLPPHFFHVATHSFSFLNHSSLRCFHLYTLPSFQTQPSSYYLTPQPPQYPLAAICPSLKCCPQIIVPYFTFSGMCLSAIRTTMYFPTRVYIP